MNFKSQEQVILDLIYALKKVLDNFELNVNKRFK